MKWNERNHDEMNDLIGDHIVDSNVAGNAEFLRRCRIVGELHDSHSALSDEELVELAFTQPLN